MIYFANTLNLFIYRFITRHLNFKDNTRFFVKSNVFGFFCTLQFVVIVGLRGNVGADYVTYERMYEYYGMMDTSIYHYNRVEIGWKLLCYLFYNFGLPFWIFTLTIAFLTYVFLYKAIVLLSKDTFLSYYLYISFNFMYFAMNQMREGLVIAIGLYAIALLSNDKRKRFVFYILLATSFHYIAILYLSLLLLRNIEINFCGIIHYFLGIIILYVGFDVLKSLLMNTIYGFYFGSGYENNGSMTIYLNTVLRLILLIMVLSRIRYVEHTSQNVILYHMCFICMLIQILTLQSSLFGRVTTIFYIAYIILIPEVINTFKTNRKFMQFLCIVFASIYHFVYFSHTWRDVLGNEYSLFLSK